MTGLLIKPTNSPLPLLALTQRKKGTKQYNYNKVKTFISFQYMLGILEIFAKLLEYSYPVHNYQLLSKTIIHRPSGAL